MEDKTYSAIQRQIGFIEGAAFGVQTDGVRSAILDACAVLSDLIEEARNGKT